MEGSVVGVRAVQTVDLLGGVGAKVLARSSVGRLGVGVPVREDALDGLDLVRSPLLAVVVSEGIEWSREVVRTGASEGKGVATRTGRQVVTRVGGLVERHETVDLAVMQPEDRVEGGRADLGHVLADQDVHGAVDAFARRREIVVAVDGEQVKRGLLPTLEGIEQKLVGVAAADDGGVETGLGWLRAAEAVRVERVLDLGPVLAAIGARLDDADRSLR